MSNTVELIARLKDEMTAKLKSIDGSMTNFVQGVGAAAGATIALSGAILAVTKKFSDMASRINDAAAGLQVSTDAYQALGYVFRQTGGDADTFNTAVRGIDTFMRGAAEGTEGNIRLIEQLGLSYEDMASMNHEEQFYLLSEAIKSQDDALLRSTSAQQVFGRQYQQVLSTIMQTTGTMEEATRAFMDAGLGISAEDIASLDEFGDRWDTMMQRLQVAGVEAIGPLLPVIEDMMGKLEEVAADALPGIVAAAGSVAQVIGFLAEHIDELTALVVGFGTAILASEIRLNGFGSSMIQATVKSKAFAVAVGSLKAIVGNLGLGLAISFTVDKVMDLVGAMNDAHDANMGLSDNLQSTADLLNTAVATGFMTADEAAAQMRASMDALAESANLSAMEEMTLRGITEQLAGTLSSATINMDTYIGRLAGVSKGSYDAAIATLQMQRAFSEGVFGADSAVTANLDTAISQLQGLRQEAEYAARALDKAFAGPSTTSQEGQRSTGDGTAAADEEHLKSAEAYAEALELARDAREAELALADAIMQKQDAMYAEARAARAEEVAHRNAVQAKLENTQSEQEASQDRINDQLIGGAQQMSQIMMSGAKDWEEQMMKAIIKMLIVMGLNALVPGMGNIAGGFLPFSTGGTVRHAATGTTVPDTGAYGDRHPYLLERGEVVISRQQVLQGQNTPQRSVSMNLTIGSMFSSASKTELLRSADVMIQAFRERGIHLG